MHIAVTGATGFLGRHVIPALLAQDLTVTAVLRPGGEEKPWIDGLAKVAMDLSKPPGDLFESLGRPDAVIHLAWQGLPNYKSLHHFETELPFQYRFLISLV